MFYKVWYVVTHILYAGGMFLRVLRFARLVYLLTVNNDADHQDKKYRENTNLTRFLIKH